MKVYIATKHRESENKEEVEAFCKAVRNAGMVDFDLIRDAAQYEHASNNPQEFWELARDEIVACDAFLIDVSNLSSEARLVEMGVAYAKQMPIIVVKRHTIAHNPVYDGVASVIIEYVDHKDLSRQLRQYDKDRNFSVTDKMSMLIMLLMLGFMVSWGTAQIFMPLGAITPVIYWLLVRFAIPTMRAYDRLIIYIPLIAIWLAGYALLEPLYIPLALAWLIVFWVVMLIVLKKIRLSL